MNIEKRGDIILSNQGPNNQFRKLVLFASSETVSEESILGIIEAEEVFSPGDYFISPNTGLEPFDIETETPRITIQYRDELRKSQHLTSPYQVTLVFVFVEKHPDIEKISNPDERKRLYDRAISNSLFATKG